MASRSLFLRVIARLFVLSRYRWYDQFYDRLKLYKRMSFVGNGCGKKLLSTRWNGGICEENRQF